MEKHVSRSINNAGSSGKTIEAINGPKPSRADIARCIDIWAELYRLKDESAFTPHVRLWDKQETGNRRSC